MGYLNNATTVLDAILTKKGRELLSRGQNEFNITKFAVADDEVDYSLWDVSHPQGTDYYGNVIENLPLLEPTPDTNTIMRYKLVTRAVGTRKMSSLIGVQDTYNVNWSSLGNAIDSVTISPSTTNVPNDGTSDPDGYSFTILNSSIAYVKSGNGAVDGSNGGIDYVQSTQNISQTVFGSQCTITAKAIAEPAAGEKAPSTTLIVTGLTYGATIATTINTNYVNES
tara:strand:- start:372 stop:1046 length:675 start_codon:yes stop_codon:yes gene_type:complete